MNLGGFKSLRHGMSSLKGSDFSFVLQSQSNVIEPVQQAMSHERVNREVCTVPLIIPNLTLLQINGQFVVVDLLRSTHNRSNFGIAELYGQETVLRRVVGEDIGKR